MPYAYSARRMIAALLVFIGMVAPLGVTAQARPATRPLSLVTLWSPQAQFAGYYAAVAQGFYAARGLDVRIIDGGPGVAAAELLRDGTADAAVLWLTTALRQADAGTPIVHLAQVGQRSSLLLVTKATSGIRSVADMAGRSVGLWGGDLAVAPRALFAREGIRVREVPQSFTVNLFLRGGLDVASAMWYNEYHTIFASGVNVDELHVFPLRDQGIDVPEDGLYMLAATVAADPASATALVEATREGWAWAFANPEAALDLVLERLRAAHLPANRVHQRWMLNAMRDVIAPEGSPTLLPVRPAAYDSVTTLLRAAGAIQRAPTYDAFLRGPDARR